MGKNKGTGHIRAHIYCAYQKRARKRGVEFCLTRTQFEKLMQMDCYICGAEPSNRRVNPQNGAIFTYNGIDRLDNSVGYIKSNSRPCCWLCNNIKSSTGLIDLKRHLKKMITGLREVA